MAGAAAIFGLAWVFLQIGDRLWFKKHDDKAQADAAKPNEVIVGGLERLLESQGRLIDSQAEMSKATTALVAESRANNDLDRMRHEEVIRMLLAIERLASALVASKDAFHCAGAKKT